MEDHGFHFMALAKKLYDLVFANLVIMLGGCRPKLHFLELRALLVFALLVRLLIRLVKEFSVIGDLADWRLCIRRNLHQVQATLPGQPHRFERLHHAQLPAVVVYHTNFPSPDAFVYPGAFCSSKTSFSDNPTSAPAPGAAGSAVLCTRTASGSIAPLSAPISIPAPCSRVPVFLSSGYSFSLSSKVALLGTELFSISEKRSAMGSP